MPFDQGNSLTASLQNPQQWNKKWDELIVWPPAEEQNRDRYSQLLLLTGKQQLWEQQDVRKNWRISWQAVGIQCQIPVSWLPTTGHGVELNCFQNGSENTLQCYQQWHRLSMYNQHASPKSSHLTFQHQGWSGSSWISLLSKGQDQQTH